LTFIAAERASSAATCKVLPVPRALVPLLVVSLVAGCARPGATRTVLEGDIFASRWRVVLPEHLDARATDALRLDVERALLDVEGHLSSWAKEGRPASDVTRCNASPAHAPCPVAAETADVVKKSLDVAEGTDGAFDITVGPLLELWGFTPTTKGKAVLPPSPAALAAALRRVDRASLHVEGGARPALVRGREDVVVDVTAVTDGAAAAAIARLLRARGLAHFLVDVAGEVVVSGSADGREVGAPWRVGLSDARRHADESPDDADVAADVVSLGGDGALHALSTSGSTRDTRDVGGRTVSHIVDPRTGEPVVTELVSCTVVGPDIVVADALSTACLVLGREGTEAALSRFPGTAALYGLADGRLERGRGFPGPGRTQPIPPRAPEP
jgi:thiamine biosynthesis lipoprotein